MLIRHAAMQSSPPKLYADDVFQSYTRTGTGAEQTITTNIDMTQGYMVWSKGRSGVTDHAIYDSVRVVTKDLVTNSTAAETTQAQGLKSVSSTGHTWGTLAKVNTSTATYVDWIYRVAPKFFALSQVVKSAGSDATVSFSNLETLGMVIVKRTDSTGSWYVWHRSLTAGKLLYLEQTAAEATLGHITVSGTTVTLENGVIADGTYIVYAYAHDTSTDGIIQCGSFTTDGSGNATVTLGWEPQYLMGKMSSTPDFWYVMDTARSLKAEKFSEGLYPNSSSPAYTNLEGRVTATGFICERGFGANVSSQTWIYIAIRRPNKPPTSGTQVYNAIARTGTGAAAAVSGVGFSPDSVWHRNRGSGNNSVWDDRLRGATRPFYLDTSVEQSNAQSVTSFDMDGEHLGTDTNWNGNGLSLINHFFKRAKGFFDIVCYTGTGSARTINHNLGAVPELMIVKGRSYSGYWFVYTGNNAKVLYLHLTNSITDNSTAWNNTTPTATSFTLGSNSNVNYLNSTFVAYLFASLPGISKIGSYTGNGTTQNIDMGFSTGCRFFLVKRTDSTGDWWVFDSTRGITAAADNALQLNSTVAEITTADAIDNYAAGITVNQETTCNINVNNATYIYMGIS